MALELVYACVGDQPAVSQAYFLDNLLTGTEFAPLRSAPVDWCPALRLVEIAGIG